MNSLHFLKPLGYSLICSTLFLVSFVSCNQSSQKEEEKESPAANNVVSTGNESTSANLAEETSKNVAEAGKETTVSTEGAPVFTFEKDEYAFGEVKEGEAVKHVFSFTNTGKSPLIIENATASCGCTVPDWPKEPIAPGQKSQINVEFDSKGKSGMQNKTITITANTNPAITTLKITGTVKANNNMMGPLKNQ